MNDFYNVQHKKSMSCKVGGTVNALSLSRDNFKIVVAGRSLLKVFGIDENLSNFKEELKLYFTRVQRSVNYSDVAWSPNNESLIATASTNGTVATWDLSAQSRNKQLTSFKDHQRCVTKISFHPTECQKLLSGSQDNTMKIFDLRLNKEAYNFSSYGNGVRNVQFSPYNLYQFAASFDNGNVEVWDYRSNKSALLQFIAHERFVYSLEWHPDSDKKNVLATGGSDKMVKVWDVSQYDKKTNDISTTSSVACVRWRPNRPEQLATTALGTTAIIDYSVFVWDLRRRFVPFAYFDDDSHGSQVFNAPTSGAESEIHSEDGRNELEDYFNVIAKGRQPDFYISDDDAIPSFGYDGVTSEADFLTDQEWGTTLQVPSEAIVQKEALDTDSIANFGHVDVPLAVANQSIAKRTILTPHGGRWHETAVAQAETKSSSPSPPADSQADTLTEKDLVVKPSLWPDPLQTIRDELIFEQLKWFAETSDVQTAVSMILVLSAFSLLRNVSEDEDLVEHWQLSYLNLLAKHQLWVTHEQVVKLSKIQSIREMSTSSNVQVCCKICLRRTPAGTSWLCDRRFDADHANQCASCFLCNLPVTRLYTYCQACCMGGHLKCVQEWMRRNKYNVCRYHCV